MKNIFYFFLVLIIPFSSNGQASNQWVSQQLNSTVSVFFPSMPQKNDTLGQTLFHYTEGDDVMIASTTLIPDSLFSQTNINLDTVLNNFIQSSIQGATTLIYSKTMYKNQNAIFYKVRIDDELNPIKGLIVDSYNFILEDTIYSISYLRYHAKELYNYNQQRKYFDMVEIHSIDHISTDSATNSNTDISIPGSDTTSKNHIPFIALILVIAIGVAIFYNKKRKNIS
ncbi:MAG: hypothetical protein M9958_10530 [Chitinophagales bacterium]|nr:hypothetical protein [Chitinophagales bacterium]